jgi:hypothetical protein
MRPYAVERPAQQSPSRRQLAGLLQQLGILGTAHSAALWAWGRGHRRRDR